MNKKQKRSLIEIIVTIFLLLICQILYPLLMNKLNLNIKEGIFFYIHVLLYLITYIVIGGRILLKSLKNISHGRIFDEFFLMSLATIVAFALQEFFEGVAVMLFYQIGELFQSLAVSHSRKEIKSLMEIAPKFANRIVNGEIEKIDVDEVNIDDVLLVKVGEKIPVDGIILEGESTLDTSSLTGESLPLDVHVGDEIISGSINLSKVLKIRAKTSYEESSIYKILVLIEEANESKGKTEQFISKFAKIYTPVVVIFAILLAIIPPLFDHYQFTKWILRAMSFLVISCPCALVISIPLAFFSGIGKASKKGILIKGGVYLENLNKIKTIFFDKTGTLTTGKFKVKEINKLTEENNFESLFKSIEEKSSHPLAQAIVNYFIDFKTLAIKNIQEISGKGIKANYLDDIIFAGNAKLMKENNIAFKEEKGTVIYLAKNNKCLGYVILEDEIKSEAKKTMQLLKKEKIENLIMITGDKEEIAKNVSEKLALTKYYASLLPQDKLEIVKSYKEKMNELVGYVGDGINDAPTLVTSDVAFAMGFNGSSLAIESSDIVLMQDNLLKLVEAKKIAKQTMFIAYLNIILALGVKILCLILGALGIGGMLLAIFADVGVMIICVINSIMNFYIN